LQEARDRLEPNEKEWVSLIGSQLLLVDHVFNGLRAGVRDVLASRPGEAVFSSQPPSAPESP
jgi:hypothetical protein